MKSLTITFEDQRHHLDYTSEMIDDAHIVSIFVRDQKLINIAGDRFNLLKHLDTGKEEYEFEAPPSARGRELKKIIAEEVRKTFRKSR